MADLPKFDMQIVTHVRRKPLAWMDAEVHSSQALGIFLLQLR